MTTSHRAPVPRGEALSAHRRPGTREAAEPRRRPAGARERRRTGSRRRRSVRFLPLLAGTALLGIAAMAGPGVVRGGWTAGSGDADPQRIVLSALPADAPEQGLIYDGLDPAGPESICA